jgi:starch synthase
LYQTEEKIKEIRQRMMQIDFSWETSVKQYLDIYQSLK